MDGIMRCDPRATAPGHNQALRRPQPVDPSVSNPPRPAARTAVLTGKVSGRTGRPRTLHLPARAVEFVIEQPKINAHVFNTRLKKPWTKDGLYTVLERAGIRSTYSLRHTFAQWFLDHGGPGGKPGDKAELQEWLGHVDGRTSLIRKFERSGVPKTVCVEPLLNSCLRGDKREESSHVRGFDCLASQGTEEWRSAADAPTLACAGPLLHCCPSPRVEADRAAAVPFPVQHTNGAGLEVDVLRSQRQRLTDPELSTPQDHDESAVANAGWCGSSTP